ncbi:MAG: hypothetical protein D6693_10095, partial [Planctomycetota bacterium]
MAACFALSAGLHAIVAGALALLRPQWAAPVAPPTASVEPGAFSVRVTLARETPTTDKNERSDPRWRAPAPFYPALAASARPEPAAPMPVAAPRVILGAAPVRPLADPAPARRLAAAVLELGADPPP